MSDKNAIKLNHLTTLALKGLELKQKRPRNRMAYKYETFIFPSAVGEYMKTIIFESTFKQEILSCFDKEIKNGIIVERKTGVPVVTEKGEQIKRNEFGGIKKGSEIYVKNDITSLIDFAKRK